MAKTKNLNYKAIYLEWTKLNSYTAVANLLSINRETVRSAVRRAQGLCFHCSTIALPGYTVCERHLVSARAVRMSLYYNHKAANVCHKCGKKPIFRNVYCEDCYPTYHYNARNYSRKIRYGGCYDIIMARDKAKCQMCGKLTTTRNRVFHKCDGSDHEHMNPLLTNAEAFITLCRHCHVALHTLASRSPQLSIDLVRELMPLLIVS